MTCKDLGDQLHGYLDNELDAAGAADFERHVDSCAQCSDDLRAERTLRESLASARLYERAPASLRRAVESQVLGPRKAEAPAGGPWKWLAIAAMTLFAISSGILTFTLLHMRGGGATLAVAAVDAHLRSLQQGHLADVPSTDQHTVKPWFDGRVDFAPRVSDFSAQGFPLLGGRLDVLNGSTVAALVYGRRKHIINVFVAPQGRNAFAEGAGERQGYHWLGWQTGGFDYLAVSDVAAADLAELRSLIENQ